MDNSFVGQKYVIYAVNSRVDVQNSNFQSTTLESKLLMISESDITLTNNSFSNLTCSSQDNEILYLVKAYTQIDTLNYTGSDCQLINSGLSQVDMKKMNVKDITLQQKTLITLLNSQEIEANNQGNMVETSLTDSSFSGISTLTNTMIHIKDSGVSKVENTSFVNITSLAVDFIDCQVSSIDSSNFTNNKE